MPVKRRVPKGRNPSVSQIAWALLTDEETLPRPLSPDEEGERFVLDDLDMATSTGPSLADLWRSYGDEIVAEWVRDRPGTRPAGWWRFSAPDEEMREGETEAAYLERLGLLAPGERRKMAGR